MGNKGNREIGDRVMGNKGNREIRDRG